MSDLALQLNDYRLTTAEILYRLPDHPRLLQTYVWQELDLLPDFRSSSASWTSGNASWMGGCIRCASVRHA